MAYLVYRTVSYLLSETLPPILQSGRNITRLTLHALTHTLTQHKQFAALYIAHRAQ